MQYCNETNPKALDRILMKFHVTPFVRRNFVDKRIYKTILLIKFY